VEILIVDVKWGKPRLFALLRESSCSFLRSLVLGVEKEKENSRRHEEQNANYHYSNNFRHPRGSNITRGSVSRFKLENCRRDGWLRTSKRIKRKFPGERVGTEAKTSPSFHLHLFAFKD
jgi:hypothetical protein